MILRELEGGVIETLAPAKVNLFLEVLGKRGDGYHELETLMASLDFFDTLHFADDPSGGIHLECDDPELTTGPDNLVVRAALALKEATGSTRGARITLQKRIPSRAGLGGGSSDAASTLAGLNRLWNLGCSTERLSEIAGTIGSDVPFFLATPAAVCRGRGERVESTPFGRRIHLVLLCPDFGVSTADVYRGLKPPSNPLPVGPAVEALRNGDPVALGKALFNRLQPVAESIEPRLATIREVFGNLGPSLDGSMMSGSGSAYFGLCRDESAAGHAAHQLERLGLGRVRAVTCGP